MKRLITYSSRTGNTKSIAESIFEIMPEGTELFPIEEAPDPSSYDFITIGFWTDRANADEKAQTYMKRIKGKKVALFGTLGADPDSEHAIETMKNAKQILDGNEVMGTFMCRGKIDPQIIQRLEKLPEGHPHGMTPERRRRHAEASKHPNPADCKKAQAVFQYMFLNL